MQKQEVSTLREDQVAYHNLRNEYEKVKKTASQAKSSLGRLAELEALVVTLQTNLEKEKKEKEGILSENKALMKERDEVRVKDSKEIF